MTFSSSYYGNIKNIPEDYILVSISGGITDEIRKVIHKQDTRLAPKKKFFLEYKDSTPGNAREAVYVKNFKEQVLADVDLNKIFREWSEEFGKNKHFVILCYETPEDFCHRQIVSEAIENKYSINVPELGVDMDDFEKKDYKYQQKTTLDEDEW